MRRLEGGGGVVHALCMSASWRAMEDSSWIGYTRKSQLRKSGSLYVFPDVSRFFCARSVYACAVFDLSGVRWHKKSSDEGDQIGSARRLPHRSLSR